MTFEGSYLIEMVTGCANVAPVGPKSNVVPATTRSFAGKLLVGATEMFRVCVRAPAGISSETVEFRTLNDAPALDTTAPSLTLTSIEAVWPSTDAVIIAVPMATPVTTPAATADIDGRRGDADCRHRSGRSRALAAAHAESDQPRCNPESDPAAPCRLVDHAG